jgi:hypothetical protein
MTVELRIDTLVLHGVAPGRRDAVARQLATTLAGLLAGGALPAGLGRSALVERLDARGALRPGRLGADAATALHRRLGSR